MNCNRRDSRILLETKWPDLYTNILCPIEDTDEELDKVVACIFQSSGMLSESSGKGLILNLRNMISSVRGKYNGNKYHSFAHACHVLLNCAKILHDISSQSASFSKVEGLALLFAALIHDIGHLGVSNDTLVFENHNLALLYSDQSVAEMHSLASGFELLNHPDRDIRSGFSSEEKKTFRNVVIDLVLSTNVTDNERQRLLQQKLDNTTKLKSLDGKIDMSIYTNRLSVYNLVIRAADVGASMQNAETSRIWSHRFFLEQKDARNAGRGPPADDSEFCCQHGKFIERHAAALATSLISTGALSAILSRDIMESTRSNIATWLVEGPSIVNSWSYDSDDKVSTF